MNKPFFQNEQEKNEFLTWIAFLKAGVFNQAFSAAQKGNRYCIMATVKLLSLPEEVLDKDSHGELVGVNLSQSQRKVSPHWAQEIDREFCDRTSKSLMGLNDSDHTPFPEIADMLLEAFKDELSEETV